MANLKQTYIELVTEVTEDGGIVTQKYFTPTFIPFRTLMESQKLNAQLKKAAQGKEEDDELGMELTERTIDFIVDKVYQNKFTKDQLMDGLHSPDALRTLQEQIAFLAEGYQNDEVKKFMAKKR
ncbi:phage tail assembly chaperone G [Priestia megaterium]|uniref:phage tail assembly chaperone G n=1 Tax=Priestia megaterium TaxID=1404 RepID=UPI000BFD1FC3|nr:hypothetical protein [Priestia megaterium]PGR01351.1 hypothetical protein COA23_23155 [Priestia megaterium]